MNKYNPKKLRERTRRLAMDNIDKLLKIIQFLEAQQKLGLTKEAVLHVIKIIYEYDTQHQAKNALLDILNSQARPDEEQQFTLTDVVQMTYLIDDTDYYIAMLGDKRLKKNWDKLYKQFERIADNIIIEPIWDEVYYEPNPTPTDLYPTGYHVYAVVDFDLTEL